MQNTQLFFFLANALPMSQLSVNLFSFPKRESKTAGPIERFKINSSCRITKLSHTIDGTKTPNNEIKYDHYCREQ